MKASRLLWPAGLLLAAVVVFGASPLRAAIIAPTDLPGNVLWLDASDASTITSAGGFVSQWSDKSTVGTNHFTQGTAAEQPQTGVASLNGLNLLTLDGGNDHLVGSAVLAGNDDDYTYIAVWQPHVTKLQAVYEQAGPGASARSAMLAVGNRYGFNGQNNDRHDLVLYGGNQWRLSDMEVDNSRFNNIVLRDNGTPYAGRTGNPATLNIGTAGGAVGKKQQVFGEFLDGDLAEIIVYDRTLTPQEHYDVGAYLNNKYDLGISLQQPDLAHRWSFNDGTANDSVGTAHGTLSGNPALANGKLVLDGSGDFMTTAPIDQSIAERTFVAWVSLDSLTQPGGAGVVGLDNGDNSVGGNVFDSIVYQERTPRQWMAGSDYWRRTPANNGGPNETSTDEVMMAIVYDADASITLYRNGVPYGNEYTLGALQTYLGGSAYAVLGRRTHIATPDLDGSINEARVYNYAMSGAEIQSLWDAGIEPTGLIHQWKFNGDARDSVGTAHGTLNNGATLGALKLSVDGIDDYVRTAPVDNTIAEKTFVAWVSPDNLQQQSGGVITLENPTGTDVFDSLVFGERTAGQWMNGSNFWQRSDGGNNGGPIETVTDPGEVMLAISYELGGDINIYRDGELYAAYNAASSPISYAGGIADVLFGLRHDDHAGTAGGTPTGNDAFWAGLINEARIYDHALSLSEVRFLFNQGPVVPEPSTLVLLAVGGVFALIGLRRRRPRRGIAPGA